MKTRKYKRVLNGRFSRRKHYKLPYEEKIKMVLWVYYAGLGVLTSCYLIGGAFYESFNELKQIYNEKFPKIITVYPRTDDGDSAVDRPAGESGAETGGTDEGTSLERENPEETIRRVAGEMGFEEAENLVKIAKCESNLKPECEIINHPACTNPTNNSFDRGAFQWSRKYHPEISDECAYNVACSTKKVIDHITSGGSWNTWVCASIVGI